MRILKIQHCYNTLRKSYHFHEKSWAHLSSVCCHFDASIATPVAMLSLSFVFSNSSIALHPFILLLNFLVMRLLSCYVLEIHQGFLSCPFFLLCLPLVFHLNILPFIQTVLSIKPLEFVGSPSSRSFSHLTSSRWDFCHATFLKLTKDSCPAHSLFFFYLCSILPFLHLTPVSVKPPKFVH